MKEGKAEANRWRIFLIIVALCVLYSYPVVAAGQAEEGEKVPVTKYWMSVSTMNQTIPGMSEAMAGMGSMFGGMGGPGFGPQRELKLQLNSPWKLPATSDLLFAIFFIKLSHQLCFVFKLRQTVWRDQRYICSKNKLFANKRFNLLF